MRYRYFMLITALVITPTQAAVYLTPFVGYTAGGKVEDSQRQSHAIQGSESYALALEVPYETGRLGLFYATQRSDIDTLNDTIAMHYLHFQSSIYYPADDKLSSYLGLGLGASYADADWVDDKYGFSASIFTGLDYRLSPNIALNTQFRWLGTVVDNDTSTVCTFGDSDRCVIRFQSDWMNQFSANLGLTIQF